MYIYIYYRFVYRFLSVYVCVCMYIYIVDLYIYIYIHTCYIRYMYIMYTRDSWLTWQGKRRSEALRSAGAAAYSIRQHTSV
jgi:hypothetical protein